MKFNWGWGIFIVLVLFIAFIGNLVYKSSQVRIDLVSENYYDKEIKYQEQIEREKNSMSLQHDIHIIKNPDFVEIVYPLDFVGSQITGNIQFFKPDDASQDYMLDIRSSDLNSQIINTRAFKSGWWEIKINWTYRNTDYYKTEKILL